MLEGLGQLDPTLHWGPSAVALATKPHQKQSNTMGTRIQMLFAVGPLVKISWELWLGPTGHKPSGLKRGVAI